MKICAQVAGDPLGEIEYHKLHGPLLSLLVTREKDCKGPDLTAVAHMECRDRGEPIPPDLSLDVARKIKERYCYIAADMAKVTSHADLTLLLAVSAGKAVLSQCALHL